MQYQFQVNLRGIIDVLSEHLYSGPEVYIRELLQNAVDAITARRQLEPEHVGEVVIECHGGSSGLPSMIGVHDNGIGLTSAEVHQFLATIGQSSKRGTYWERPGDFLGQFGIGILSCFVVSDEITVLSRSARDKNAPALEWRARYDGSYKLRELQGDLPRGTQVWLTARPDRERWLAAQEVRHLVCHYGSLLPYPIYFHHGRTQEILNAEPPPWRQRFANPGQQLRALLAYGREQLGVSFFDAIPFHVQPGGIEGVAYILPFTPPLSSRHKGHRIYLKNMFLSQTADNLLPEWAFFVRVIVNVTDLRPTASREGFYEDAKLQQARAALGQCLRDYIVKLAEEQPQKMQQFVQLHHRALKALAAEDDEFCALILDHLPFETSLGLMSFADYRRDYAVIRYVSDVDTFRQLAPIAAAQNLCLLNAGYAYDLDLLVRVPELFPDLSVDEVQADTFSQEFEELTAHEQAACEEFLLLAEKTLRPFRCRVDIKKFRPNDLPALYIISQEGRFQRLAETTQATSHSLWSSVIEGLKRSDVVHSGTLCFNWNNPLIQRLLQLASVTQQQRLVEIIYVQALLLAHQPLSPREWQLLNHGIVALLDQLAASASR